MKEEHVEVESKEEEKVVVVKILVGKQLPRPPGLNQDTVIREKPMSGDPNHGTSVAHSQHQSQLQMSGTIQGHKIFPQR